MPDRRPHRPRTLAALLLAVAVSLALAGCGSQLDPAEVAGTTAGTDSGMDTTGSGTVPGSEPAAGGDGSGSDSGGTGSSGDTGTSDSGGTSDTGTDGGGEAPQGDGDNAADGGAKAGSCEGFENSPGITDKEIVIGNASDISGPVPGLFEASQEATKAYVAYFNASVPDGICGRKLVLKTYDSRSDAGTDQRAHADACDTVFAMVGSMSAFDSGGAATTEACGLPDVRSAAVTKDRQACGTCFGAQSTIAGEVNNAVPDYVLKEFPDAAQNAAMLFINAGAAAENGPLQAEAMTKRGMRFTYVRGIDVAEFNYAPYVQQMKDKDIGYVQMIAQPAQFIRLTDAMKQQGFEPDVLMIDPSAYDPDYVEGGDNAEGTTVFTNFTPFEEASRNQETQLYLSWLQQVKPGAQPSFFGVFSWSAARLFVETAISLGGKLSRESLVQALFKVDNWTANDMHAPQHVGPHHTGDCFRFIQLRESRWVPIEGTRYHCSGTTKVG